VILPGYHCTKCQGFNGEGKEVLVVCRYCGETRPNVVTAEEARALALEVIAGKTRSYVQAAVTLARFVEEGTKVQRMF